ncbi:MAG: hypothetical protein ACJAU3_001903 [Zhongshania sp.]
MQVLKHIYNGIKAAAFAIINFSKATQKNYLNNAKKIIAFLGQG